MDIEDNINTIDEEVTTLDNVTANDFCRVLLLEDDDVDFQAIRRALDRSVMCFEYDRATYIADVKTLVNNKKYDIVISDMNLPDSNGLETITSLLNLVGKTPIVVLSGTDDDSIALEAVHVGAQDFIPKQYIGDTGLINRTLRHAMERHQLKLGLESIRDRERFLAHYDQCTFLPNRLLFLDRIHQAVIQAQRNQNSFVLFFIDLDHFKNVNDSIGHAAGDEVLHCVGKRMQNLVRKSDTVARFGGDEFVMILQLSNDDEAMERLASKVIDTINQPIPYGQHICNVGASIGIASYPRHGSTPEELIKNADMAMYESKKKGRNQVQFFSQVLLDQKSKSFDLEKSLREALREPDKNFVLYYQPRIELLTGNIYSVEALIRWQHSELGNIPPDQFIPLAEELGLIEQIDEWVIEAACQKAVQWKAMQANVSIGINVSARSINRQNFVKKVIEPLLEKYDIEGSCLEIEITENALLVDSYYVLECLQGIKRLGIRLAIDDFGIGFSSISYLTRFPIDTFKIDGSFMCDQQSSESDQVLLKAIIALGVALGMKVVADCVETEAQSQYLLSLHCHEGLGYYWHQPDEHWNPL